MKPRALLAFAAVVALCASPVRGDEATPFVRLAYRCVTTNEDVGEHVNRKAPFVPRVESTFEAVLGPRRVEVVENKRSVLFDFDHERLLRVEADGSYRETSLLSRAGFVEIEMANRERIASVLAKAKTNDASYRPRELSILFGVRAHGDETKVVAAADGEATIFRDGDEELARWTPSTETLDEAQRESLSRLLLDRCRLHPAVREAIVADGRAPASLRCRFFNTGTRSTIELSLVGPAKRSHDAGSTPLGRRVFDESDQLARIARRVLDPSKEDLGARLSTDDFLRLSKEARTAGRCEDAALLLLECGLQTAADVTGALRDLRSDEKAGPRVESALGAISVRDKAKQLEGLDALDRSLFSRPWTIDVFRANCFAQTKRLDQGRTTMLGALERAPWLTGAWKDVGDMCYARFDAESAWLAWEAGRRANPDHPMWKPLRDYEEHLRKQFHEML